MVDSFSSLRIRAGISLGEIASEWSVGDAQVLSWETGGVAAPANIRQALKTLASLRPAAPLSGVGRRVLSFFTGGGGLDLGFEAAGFETVYATDIDADSCATLRTNIGKALHADLVVERADIRRIDPERLPGGIDLVIGGPPCQSFSASGRRAGGAAGRLDDRGTLFEAYCRIIAAVSPAAFVFENVRGILGTNKGEDWRAIVAAFSKLGYAVSYRLLDALDYGAPQQRERLFLVGHRLAGDFLFPRPTHGPDSVNGVSHITAGEALAGIVEDEDLASLALATGKYAHLLPLVPPGQNYLHFTAKRGYPRPIFAYRSRFSDFLYKADPAAPVKTIIASPGKYTGPLHWDNRYFSMREYRRLQGFPDDYAFHGTRDSVIRQIGNSVSPKVAERLALAVAAQIFGANTAVPLIEAHHTLSFDKRKGAKAKKTRQMHAAVAERAEFDSTSSFLPLAYEAMVEPSPRTDRPNVLASVEGRHVRLDVSADGSEAPFARMRIELGTGPAPLPLDVVVRGHTAGAIQTMWNAIDDWVRRSSDFHSLFELYGHFTEPHPIFSVASFEAVSPHPIATFAAHAADFANCSRYFPKTHLVDLFGATLNTDSFAEIATYLRRFRFDIRSHETNIAIDPEQYMVAYPFTLPARRQMNFAVRDRDAERTHLKAAVA